VQKQIELAEKFNKFESKKIPPSIDYTSIPGLSKEVIEKLREVQPETIGQAGRIPGITPAAVSILLVAAERFWKQSRNS
jgi:tRNA uridine 5-carboxymethylaminomethyl modification enzyme